MLITRGGAGGGGGVGPRSFGGERPRSAGAETMGSNGVAGGWSVMEEEAVVSSLAFLPARIDIIGATIADESVGEWC